MRDRFERAIYYYYYYYNRTRRLENESCGSSLGWSVPPQLAATAAPLEKPADTASYIITLNAADYGGYRSRIRTITRGRSPTNCRYGAPCSWRAAACTRRNGRRTERKNKTVSTIVKYYNKLYRTYAILSFCSDCGLRHE